MHVEGDTYVNDIRVDAELVRGIARSLRRAAASMDPEFDRAGAEDRTQREEGRRHRIDTLAGSRTAEENFGDFEAGQSLRRVYNQARRQSVETADERSQAVRRYALALERCLQDLEDTDELGGEHFRAIGRIAVEVPER